MLLQGLWRRRQGEVPTSDMIVLWGDRWYSPED